jgi:hypothetical protein
MGNSSTTKVLKSAAAVVSALQKQDQDGHESSLIDQVSNVRNLAELGALPTLIPVLPLLLNLNGKPYSLKDHFPFGQLFRNHKPRKLVLKTGRQVSKSTSLAAHGVVVSAMHPHFATLYVTPLYEQIRRFSNNYVRPFIDESPVKSLWIGPDTEQSVMQRGFLNLSKMFFSFALLDADRIRGIRADQVCIDECQDMDPDHIPIIHETMSYSEHELAQYTGTPKTMDNTIEGFWQLSSQAEWFIRCEACNRWNIPAMEFHIDKMLGPPRDDISENQPGIICYHCRRPVVPRTGRWVHRYPERRWDFAGYHVPQAIMPVHYSNPDKWSTLIGKREGWGSVSPNMFYNEVLGESYDVGQKLVTLSDIKKAAVLPWENDQRVPPPAAIEAAKSGYLRRVLAVDWGGGGMSGVSFTVLAVLGFAADGRIDCLWGCRLLTPHDHLLEAQECMARFHEFGCDIFAHDYTGAGILRETFMTQAGFPLSRIMPIAYVRAATKAPMYHVPKTQLHPRDHYRADKTRTLLYTTTALKTGLLRFFQYDFKSTDNPGLLHDFLSLVENKVETRQASDLYMIGKAAGLPDDFAQAVNIGCVSLWHISQAWPNFANAAAAQMSPDQVQSAVGPDPGLMGGYAAIP